MARGTDGRGSAGGGPTFGGLVGTVLTRSVGRGLDGSRGSTVLVLAGGAGRGIEGEGIGSGKAYP